MKFAGIDIGSRSIKVVVVDNECNILDERTAPTTFDPMTRCNKLLAEMDYDHIQATGYGRHLFTENRDIPVVSEIMAHARGARFFVPEASGVLDIGGQDTKAISLTGAGKVLKFEMNDRCAAGTGKFLEVMAKAFDIDIREFGDYALEGKQAAKISSMCTVFAESEATSLMAKGEEPANIALGLHLAVAKRAVSMVKRVVGDAKLTFTGGVANNRCMRKLVESEMGDTLLMPEKPEYVGACGAALLLMESS